jgi:hypothetical protein
VIESVTQLLVTVENQLAKLRIALTAFAELRVRDKTGSDPNLQSQYRAHIKDIEEVGIYCALELTGALDQLRKRLDGTTTADTVDQMMERMAEAPSAFNVRESLREERSAKDVSEAQFSNKRETMETRQDAAVVAVTPALLERLQANQERLGEYIQGYFSCQELNARCQRAQSDLYDAQNRGLKISDVDSVRRFLNDMFGMVTGLGPSFTEDSEFADSLKTLDRAVRDARGAVRAVAQENLSEGVRLLIQYLNEMRDALDDIATLCPRKANTNLGYLRDGINQILGQIERQREARQSASDLAAATKTGRQPFSTTESTIRKAV